MGRSENDAARRWHHPEREKLVIQPAVASRPAMISHRYNETSSQPVNDLGGVPAVRDSFGKASAPWGYVTAKLTAACNMLWFPKGACRGCVANTAEKKYASPAPGVFRCIWRWYFKERGEGMGLSVNDAFRSILKDYPDVMNIEQMSEVLGISTKTGYKLLKDGTIMAMKVGRTYRIPKVHILSYLRVLNSTS